MAYRTFGVELKHLYLIMSDECNINCSFCYKKNSVAHNGLMTEQIALDAIDFFLNKLDVDDREMRIFFWGGEPLMNLKVIKKVISEYPQMTYFSNTNGELITEDVYKYLSTVSNLVLTLSAGSGRERYGSFQAYLDADKIKWAIKLIEGDAKNKYINLVANNPLNLVEDFQLIYNKGIKNISIDIPTGNSWEEETYKIFEDKFLELLKNYEVSRFNSNIFKNNLWLETFGPREKIAPKGARFCNSGLERILVDPKGNIWQCDNFYLRQYNQLGDIYKGIDVSKLEYLKEFAEDVAKTKKHCQGCEIFYYCPRNKCLGLNRELTGDIMQPDKSWCRANKAWINITKKYIDYLKEKEHGN